MTTEEYKDLISRLRSLQTSDQSEHPLRKELYNTIRTLFPSLEHPQDTINRIVYSPLQLVAARIGCDLGIFELLNGSSSPVDVAEIARLTQSDPLLLRRVLRYLAANGMIKETDEDCFTSTNVTGILSTARFKAGVIHNSEIIMPCWQQLPTFLKDTAYSNPSDFSRTPFQLAHNTDQPAFVWGRNHPERTKFFKLWMTATHEDHKSWLDVFPPERFCDNSHKGTVLFVDIGGGIGHQVAALKARLSETHTAGRLILQDRPATIEQALPTEGVEKMEFDFWGQQPIKDARAYYLRNILHDYPDEKCIEILHRTIDAMGAHSLILIDDMVLPKVGAHWHATELDLTMMSTLASMERSEIEWRNLLERAGLQIQTIESYTEDTRDSIIVAIRSGHHGHPS